MEETLLLFSTSGRGGGVFVIVLSTDVIAKLDILEAVLELELMIGFGLLIFKEEETIVDEIAETGIEASDKVNAITKLKIWLSLFIKVIKLMGF